VRDAVGLTFRYEARDIRRHGTAKQRLHYYDVSFGLDHLIYFDSEIRHGLQQASPDLLKAAAKRHDTLFAIRKVSPLRAVSYQLHGGRADEVIALEASAAADVRRVFWFDGAALIGEGPVSKGALAWRPIADGAHLIRVIDDHGRVADRDVQVRLVN